MRSFLAGIALLAAVAGVLLISDGASASNAIQGEFAAAYPSTSGTALASCSTCHTSVPALNAYGSALQASGLNFAGIESLDSDGDGFSNGDEIRAFTNPGVASDRPTVTTSTSIPTTSTSTTTSTTMTTAAAPSTTTTSAAPSATAPSTAAMSFAAGPAGTVWIEFDNGRLVVTDVETTWSYEIEEELGYDIQIEFWNGDQEVEFEAELEHGKIETEVNIDNDSDDGDDDRSHDDDHENEDHDDDGHDDDGHDGHDD